MSSPVLQLKEITKRFGGLVANDAISLHLDRGEVLALLGENGSGKSTLVSILFGHYVADTGSIEVSGKPLTPGNPKASLAAGIGMVHQHFALADNLTVLENIVIGTESLWRPFAGRQKSRQRVAETARRFGLAVNPDALVRELSVGERQRVEILKSLYRGVRILILDEPTAALTPQESEALFGTLNQLVEQGLSLIFISHKLAEVLRVSNRIAILRGGKLVATRDSRATNREELAELMVGRNVQQPVRQTRTVGKEVLRLANVHAADMQGRRLLEKVDLAVRAGEIIAIAGVAGNGQQALAELLSGTLKAQAGTVAVNGMAMRASPRDWLAARVARIPEDRHAVGAIGDLPVWENAISERILPSHPDGRAFSRFGLIRRAAARRFAQDLVTRFDVRLGSIDMPIRALSGGNMQKLILGRALSVGSTHAATDAAPALVIACKPTWGLDIGAVAYVHDCLFAAAAGGAAVLLISEDLDEIFAVADRIGVMHAGRLSALRPVGQWTRGAIGMAMAGMQPAVIDEDASRTGLATMEKPHAV